MFVGYKSPFAASRLSKARLAGRIGLFTFGNQVPPPAFLFDFTTGSLAALIGSGTFAVTRATPAWVRDPSTGSITQVANNVAQLSRDPDGVVRLHVDEQRTQFMGLTAAPATQTTGSLGTGTYVLWVEGSGSAAVSAGTATITGAGSATQAAPLQFTVTVAGTVTVTKTGTLSWFQLENGAVPTNYILNNGAAGTTVVRNADVVLLTPFAAPATGTILIRMMMQGIDGSLDATARHALNISEGVGNEVYRVQRNASSQAVSPVILDGGVSQLTAVARNFGPGVRVSVAFRYATNDFAASANGQAVQTDTSVTLPTTDRVYLGSNHVGTASFWCAGIEQFAVWNTPLPNHLLPGIAA